MFQFIFNIVSIGQMTTRHSKEDKELRRLLKRRQKEYRNMLAIKMNECRKNLSAIVTPWNLSYYFCQRCASLVF